MGERIGRIGRIGTDFFGIIYEFQAHASKKIRLDPPDLPNPFSHSITKRPNAQYMYVDAKKEKYGVK
jgi:hypothetical protein